MEANAHVIALDFDLRVPNPASSVPEIPPEYKSETDELIRSILEAADKGKKVVLGKTIWSDAKGYYLESDVYQLYGICSHIGKDGDWVNLTASQFRITDRAKGNITCGYIALPYDILMVPGQLQLNDGSHIDSFALALARAKNAKDATRFIKANSARGAYGSYISDAEFDEYYAKISAHDLLNSKASELAGQLDGQLVIVGGHWSTLAYQRGEFVDMHPTPLGKNIGAYIHANFVEAILDSRTFSPLPRWLTFTSEVLFSISAVILFAASVNFWVQLAVVGLLSVGLIIIEWTALHQFGFFFDAFVPVFALWLHSVYDRLVGLG